MKRNILTISMILALLFAISGCGNKAAEEPKPAAPEQTPYEFYQEVSKNMKQIEDAAFTGAIDVKVAEADALSMQYNAEMVQRSETDVDLAMLYDLSGISMGTEPDQTKYNIYYKDGYLYTDADGQKVKSKMDAAEAIKMSQTLKLNEVEEAVFQNAKLSAEAENTTLTFTVTEEQSKKLLEGALAASGASSASNSAATLEELSKALTIGEMDVKMTADQNKLLQSTEMHIPITINGDTEETSLKADCIVTMEYTDINTGLTIHFPDDLDQYKEVAV